MKLRLKLKGRILGFELYSFKRPWAEAQGITSRCQDLKHVVFLDYDKREYWLVKADLEILQHRFHLTPFYVFKSRESVSTDSGEEFGNYHCISLTKVPPSTLDDILRESSCDFTYKNAFKTSRYFSLVLRTSEKALVRKPQFKEIITNGTNNLKKEISLAHFNYLHTEYPSIPVIPYQNPDTSTNVFITNYKTAHSV